MTDQNQKKRTGMASLAAAGEGEDFSVIDAIGGPRGVIESMLPGVLFVVLFVVTSNLNLTIGVSAALAVLQVVIRLVQRQSVMGALSGLIAVGICLIWAWQSHEARNYYMFGFLTNAAYIVLLSFTLLIRVPGLGLMVEFIRTIPTEHFRAWLHGWLDDKPLRRAYTIVTVLWIGVFALRLIVQVPLYLADSVALLGTARLLMGIPFWALAIWVSYLIIATPLHRHIAAAKAAAGGGKDGFLPTVGAPQPAGEQNRQRGEAQQKAKEQDLHRGKSAQQDFGGGKCGTPDQDGQQGSQMPCAAVGFHETAFSFFSFVSFSVNMARYMPGGNPVRRANVWEK